LSYWPSVPSLAEQGVEAMDLGAWYGWFAPSSTPSAITQPLIDKINVMQAMPAYTELHSRLLLGQAKLDPEQIRERMHQETARYAQLVHTYGMAKID
jgi:tripartite-type tricarboxylate transporter receptor subunit TctC